MKKITAVALESARVRVSNSEDTSKVYDISATVEVSNNSTVGSIDSGEVRKDGNVIANFNAWGDVGLSVNYNSVPSDERCAVMEAISAFVADCKEKPAGLLTAINN